MKRSFLLSFTILAAVSNQWLFACPDGDEFTDPAARDMAFKEQLKDAAYDGNLEFIKKSFDQANSGNNSTSISPSELLGEALSGRQYEVIQWCAHQDPSAERISGWFYTQNMDLKAAKIILNEVPSLKTNFCKTSLSAAILGKHNDVLKFLLESGLKPADEEQPLDLLLGAIQIRNMDAISLLLQHGFDPYKETKLGFPPVYYAYWAKSKTLLQALDMDKKYLPQLAQIESELHPNSHPEFVGTWADLHEGFGSMSFHLYADGTGLVGSDIGGIPCFLKPSADGKTIKLFLLEGQVGMMKEPDEKRAISIKIDGNDLIVVMEGEERRLKTYDISKPREQSLARRPYHIQIEQICITKSDDLFVQINGRHLKFPIKTLITDSSQSPDAARNFSKDKLIFWDDFQKGPIPEEIYDQSTKGKYMNQADVNFQYDPECECLKVIADQNLVATAFKDFGFAFFHSSSVEHYYYNPGTGSEEVDGFVLLSPKKFQNGRDWITLYFQKSKSYDLPTAFHR